MSPIKNPPVTLNYDALKTRLKGQDLIRSLEGLVFVELEDISEGKTEKCQGVVLNEPRNSKQTYLLNEKLKKSRRGSNTYMSSGDTGKQKGKPCNDPAERR